MESWGGECDDADGEANDDDGVQRPRCRVEDLALGEVDLLAAVTAGSFDAEDWVDPDPDTVEGVASLLGLIKKSAAAAKAAFHRLHGAIADAAPAPAGAAWDYRDGTAPRGDLVGTA